MMAHSTIRRGFVVAIVTTAVVTSVPAFGQGSIDPLPTGIAAIPKKLIHGNGPFEFTPPEGLKLPSSLGDPNLFDVPPSFDLPPSGTTPVLVDGTGMTNFQTVIDGGGGGVPLVPGPGMMPAAGALALLQLVSRRRRVGRVNNELRLA
jgi:hypothetical protein